MVFEAVSAAAGEYAHDLIVPAAPLQLERTQYPMPGAVTFAVSSDGTQLLVGQTASSSCNIDLTLTEMLGGAIGSPKTSASRQIYVAAPTDAMVVRKASAFVRFRPRRQLFDEHVHGAAVTSARTLVSYSGAPIDTISAF